MRIEDIAYEAAGAKLTGYLAAPEGAASRAGVLLCHQGGGLSDHTKERARMLAELGYVAFALDLYGETATTRERAMELYTAMTADPPLMRARALAGLDMLKRQAGVDHARLAAIGFCMGGALVLELTRISAALKAVVSFHPGLTGLPETDVRPVTGKILLCAGALDPLVPPLARERFIALMTAAKADWQLDLYSGAGHSFTDRSVDALNIPNFAYHETTDRRSWAAMRAVFAETIG